MVIFCPIAQLGCFKASSTRICSSSSLFLPRKGPPDAVISSLSMVLSRSPFRHWKIALCSLSTGRIFTPHCRAKGIIRCPAVTSVSLLARAMSFPALMASIVGRIPIIPTIAVTRISDSSIAASSSRPSMPPAILQSVSFTFSRSSFAFSSFPTAASFG